MISRICVYCSSSAHVDPLYFEAADGLGQLIASGGYQLVFGGGNLGLMGALSRSAKDGGGYITSVNLGLFVKEGINFEAADELVVAQTMNERKRIMAERSDAFIALPGGFGTLDEIFEALTLGQLQIEKKAIGILNTNNFFHHTLKQLDHMVEEGFLKQENRDMIMVSDSIEILIEKMKTYRAPQMTKVINNVPRK